MVLSPREHLPMSGGIFGCHNWGKGHPVGCCWTSYTARDSSTTNNYPVQCINILTALTRNSAVLEELCTVSFLGYVGFFFGEHNRDSVLLSRSCSWHKFLRCMLTIFPFLEWMCLYRFKDWLLGDLLAGMSVGLVQVPQGKDDTKPFTHRRRVRPCPLAQSRQLLLLDE